VLSLLILLASPRALIDAIEHPAKAPICAFAAKDENGDTLDCLKTAQAERGRYLGLYHRPTNKGFDLCLGESKDLIHWTHKMVVSENAHQGTLLKVGKQWLLAWEQSGEDGNHIHLSAYEDEKHLLDADPAKSVDIPRTLSPAAEGTPNFVDVKYNGSWNKSVITIGFHYYRDADVDRQAVGTLRAFGMWQAEPLREVNRSIEFGYHGNVGDRDSVDLNGLPFTLMEGQHKKNDWATWRILARLGEESFQELSIVTPKASTSFANPSISAVTLPSGKAGFVITIFLPSQGNAKEEAGELIYAFPRPRI
jgi:hypothetical protein